MPARRLFVLLAALTVLSTAGLLEPRLAVVTLAADVALLAAFAIDLWRARRVPLDAERHWPPLLVQGAGAAVSVRLVWKVPAELRGRQRVRLREGLHPALAMAPRRQDLALPAARPAEWTYSVTPRRRGEVPVGPLTARVLGPWQLAWAERQLLPPEPRRVYPQVRWDGRVGQLLALAQRRELGSVPLLSQGVGREPYALREYRTGDPLGKIHWKATARHDRLITREETWERGIRLLILLDTARSMTGGAQRAGSGGAGERSKLDVSLAACLALMRVAAGRGDRVTLAAFSDRVERVVRVGGGSRDVELAYRSLYDLPARFTEPAWDLAAAQALALEPRRATVVVFTSIVDLATAEPLRAALAVLGHRHRTLLVNLEDPELSALAREAPADAPGAFAQVGALEILLANRRLGRTLGKRDTRVVTCPADRLALSALEAYLSFFRERGGR